MKATIKQGSKGEAVQIAQYLTGYAAIKKADGNYDANFVAHVCAWQRTNKLTPDGIIGPKSWKKIAETAPTCSTKKNTTSAATCAIQLALEGLEADGIFGSKTKKAVAAYQAAKGLKADGIAGSETWAALLTGDAVEAAAPDAGKFVQPVDYKQFDSRWGSEPYTSTGNKKQTIKSSGCGPTAMANIVATVKDSSVTPLTLADWSVKHGHRAASNGTSWSFFPAIAKEYNFSKFIETSSLATLKACLDAGGYAVASMGPGYWTGGGHFITIWKYDGTYIYANDPASNTRKRQKQSDFVKQRKRYFCFYK